MIVYDMATKVLDTELFPQHSIAGLISGITFIVLFSQEKPLRWKEINTHICTNVCYFSDHMPKGFEQKKPHKTMDQCIHGCMNSSKAKFIQCKIKKQTLDEKCPYSEVFWSVFSLIRTEYSSRSKIHRKTINPDGYIFRRMLHIYMEF